MTWDGPGAGGGVVVGAVVEVGRDAGWNTGDWRPSRGIGLDVAGGKNVAGSWSRQPALAIQSAGAGQTGGAATPRSMSPPGGARTPHRPPRRPVTVALGPERDVVQPSHHEAASRPVPTSTAGRRLRVVPRRRRGRPAPVHCGRGDSHDHQGLVDISCAAGARRGGRCLRCSSGSAPAAG
jgi:hypothetical protein